MDYNEALFTLDVFNNRELSPVCSIGNCPLFVPCLLPLFICFRPLFVLPVCSTKDFDRMLNLWARGESVKGKKRCRCEK